MVRWSSEPYIGESIGKKAKHIMKRLSKGKTSDNVWIITLATNPQNQLDITHAMYLRQAWVLKNLPLAVGLGGSKKEAMQLVEMMLLDTLAANGNADMRTYLVEKHTTVM